MTLAAVKPGGWDPEEVLTSDQMNELQVEMVKAIDGAGGGTYTLSAPLIFEGSEVHWSTVTRVVAGGFFYVDAGGTISVTGDILIEDGVQIDVKGDGRIDVRSGAELQLHSGAELDIDCNADFAAGNTFTLRGTLAAVGDAALTTAADTTTTLGGTVNIEINDGGRIDVNGGEIQLNEGSTLDINCGMDLVAGKTFVMWGTIALQSEASIVVPDNAEITSEGSIVSQAGGTIQVEAAEDLKIDESTEEFRMVMMPFGAPFGWRANHTSAEFTWEQIDGSGAWNIAFPLPIIPGDTLVSLFIGVNPENGHEGLPGTMPRVTIFRAALDGSVAQLAQLTDDSSLATYETTHYIALTSTSTGGAMPIVATIEPLYVLVEGEAGANVKSGLEITSITGNIIARSYRAASMVY